MQPKRWYSNVSKKHISRPSASLSDRWQKCTEFSVNSLTSLTCCVGVCVCVCVLVMHSVLSTELCNYPTHLLHAVTYAYTTFITLTPCNSLLSRVYTRYMQTDTSSKQCSTRGYKWIQLVSGLHVSGVNAALHMNDHQSIAVHAVNRARWAGGLTRPKYTSILYHDPCLPIPMRM